jgi:hypothetical protein
MRVRNVFHNAVLSVKIDGVEVKRMKKMHLAPGEMERIDLPKNLIEAYTGECITVEVVKEA